MIYRARAWWSCAPTACGTDFPNAAQIADLARSAGSKATPTPLARFMVNHALARGGGDNVTVAIPEQEMT